MPDKDSVYLTFDDGPHPKATPYALEQLEQYNAKATFFCIGNNVQKHPDIYRDILNRGHTIGNHTQNHLNGWKTDKEKYLSDISEAEQHIDSRLFRPPYGRIKRGQINALTKTVKPWKICMWDILSGDFDKNISPEQCAENVISNITPGSIIVFHDSEKAWDRMSYALPLVLEYIASKKWSTKILND